VLVLLRELAIPAERILQPLVVVEGRLDRADRAIDVTRLRDAAQRLGKIKGLRRLLQLETGGLRGDAPEMQVRDEMQRGGRETRIKASQRLGARRLIRRQRVEFIRQGRTGVLLGAEAIAVRIPQDPEQRPGRSARFPLVTPQRGVIRARVHLLQRLRRTMGVCGFRQQLLRLRQ
jgi:hypothetical protein